MEKKEINKKKFLAFLLIYFVIFTSCFSVITFSKYVGRITDATASNPIAKWQVSVDASDNDSDNIDIVIGNTTQNYILKVTSTSDVKAIYSIVLSNVPSSLRVKLDNGTYQVPTNNIITFNNVGAINANDQNRTVLHTLTFDVPIESSTISDSSVNVDVIFVQADPTTN